MARIIAAQLVEKLTSAKKTLATAESCTGGMIGAEITSVPGASAVFMGGIISYDNSVKSGILGVGETTLKDRGAVSVETAAQMAAGAKKVCGADVAVSVTGIAGPGGGSAEKPVGTVCFGIASEMGVRAVKMNFSPDGSREDIRRQSVDFAMELVIGELDKLK